MEKQLIKVDKNGTKIYHDYTCPKCGGSGHIYYYSYVQGGVCFKCNGSGRKEKPTIIKEHTPEYAKKLEDRRIEKARKAEEEKRRQLTESAAERDKEFIDNNFFGNNHIFVIKGNTFDIKETLKAEGCKFRRGIGWYSKENTRDSWCVGLNELTKKDEYGVHDWKDEFELREIYIKLRSFAEITSQHKFSIGEKVSVELTVAASIRIEGRRYSYYDDGETYINKMKDIEGNVFIWKTGKSLSGNVTLSGTVKAHEEYNGVKQTILTRCKVL